MRLGTPSQPSALPPDNASRGEPPEPSKQPPAPGPTAGVWRAAAGVLGTPGSDPCGPWQDDQGAERAAGEGSAGVQHHPRGARRPESGQWEQREGRRPQHPQLWGEEAATGAHHRGQERRHPRAAGGDRSPPGHAGRGRRATLLRQELRKGAGVVQVRELVDGVLWQREEQEGDPVKTQSPEEPCTSSLHSFLCMTGLSVQKRIAGAHHSPSPERWPSSMSHSRCEPRGQGSRQVTLTESPGSSSTPPQGMLAIPGDRAAGGKPRRDSPDPAPRRTTVTAWQVVPNALRAAGKRSTSPSSAESPKSPYGGPVISSLRRRGS
ncbi:sterile alpha motif domain-containing protein 1-like isoform X2 [Equus caballus]|uniref:sterile alpha motif domain-containing protein 1-like isoform X2 n=1 Tax=Equus caballus TaxID=9796 RepID=UPI0038B3A865